MYAADVGNVQEKISGKVFVEALEDEESSAVSVPTEEVTDIPIHGDVFTEPLDEEENVVSDSSTDNEGEPKLLILISGFKVDSANTIWCQIIPLGKIGETEQGPDGQEYHYPGPLTFEIYEKDEWESLGSATFDELVFVDKRAYVFIEIDKNKYKGQELQLVIENAAGEIIETKPLGYEEPVEIEITSAVYNSQRSILTVKIAPINFKGDEYVISDALWYQVYNSTKCNPKTLVNHSGYFSPKIKDGIYTIEVPIDPSKFEKEGTVLLCSLLKGKEISRINFNT